MKRLILVLFLFAFCPLWIFAQDDDSTLGNATFFILIFAAAFLLAAVILSVIVLWKIKKARKRIAHSEPELKWEDNSTNKQLESDSESHSSL